jgi:hypothetical protein
VGSNSKWCDSLLPVDADGEKRKLADRELAVRLSYFLWSGPPDE